MSIRFRRTKGIAPGVRLNFGKRGMSVRFGGRGFGLTLGPSGARVSAGIPGTGLYMTKRLPLARPARRPPAPSLALSDSTRPKPEPGTQPPIRWLVTTLVLLMMTSSEFPYALLAAAFTAWMTWRAYRSPKYRALKQIRAARQRANTDGDAADEAVREAAARAPDSWTVQREAAAYFVSRDDLATALEYFTHAIRLWPCDPREIMLQACDVAIAIGHYPWMIETLEPHVAAMRPEESDLDAGLLSAFALAQVGVGRPRIALEVIRRLPLQRRNLTPPLLAGLCVRALAKHALGQKAGARRDLDRAYAIDPGFPLLKKVQELIENDAEDVAVADTAGEEALAHHQG